VRITQRFVYSRPCDGNRATRSTNGTKTCRISRCSAIAARMSHRGSPLNWALSIVTRMSPTVSVLGRMRSTGRRAYTSDLFRGSLAIPFAADRTMPHAHDPADIVEKLRNTLAFHAAVCETCPPRGGDEMVQQKLSANRWLDITLIRARQRMARATHAARARGPAPDHSGRSNGRCVPGRSRRLTCSRCASFVVVPRVARRASPAQRFLENVESRLRGA
jgi:hypothetical protein